MVVEAEAELEEVVAVAEAEAALFLGVAALFLCGVVALFLRAADLLLGAAAISWTGRRRWRRPWPLFSRRRGA